jgi:hypothetical protein
MPQPRTYVVRVYRLGRMRVSGLIEDAHTGAQHPFRTLAGLCAILRKLLVRAAAPTPTSEDQDL